MELLKVCILDHLRKEPILEYVGTIIIYMIKVMGPKLNPLKRHMLYFSILTNDKLRPRDFAVCFLFYYEHNISMEVSLNSYNSVFSLPLSASCETLN